MRSNAGLLLLAACLLAGQGGPATAQWRTALPGYKYQFPRDHFSHPEYQTEWWYYTGNVRAANGRRFGFELTFFRQAQNIPPQVRTTLSAAWCPDQVYLAHLALSDIDGRHFYHAERLNRAGPGLAGAGFNDQRYWNGNWQVRWLSLDKSTQRLQAVDDQFSLALDLDPQKPPVIQGENGVDPKGPALGQASHYISFTRLSAKGSLTLKGARLSVEGSAWMDHEFFTEPAQEELAGWDWFAIQLDGSQELMLYRLRLRSGAPDPYSSGTFVDAKGNVRRLSAADFTLQPAGSWPSSQSKARYPADWKIAVPSLGLDLTERTDLPDQELRSPDSATATYWEGAVSYTGTLQTKPAKGVGYLEMTGYDKPVSLSGQASSNMPKP